MAVTGRTYTVSFSNVTVSAVQDLLAVKASATQPIALLSANLGQITGTSVANLRVRLQITTALTFGSGGSAPTPAKWSTGDAAAGATAHINDTSQSGSTFTDLWDDVWNTVNGFIWVPPQQNRPPVAPAAGGFRLSLDTAPALGLVSNGTFTFEEVG